MTNLYDNLNLIFQRLDWRSLLDIFLVTLIFFVILLLVRDTQALVLLRGVFLLIVLLYVLTSLVPLPAFSWLIRTALPSLVFVIPVIFAPEIRRGLEKLGRAGSGAGSILPRNNSHSSGSSIVDAIHAVVSATGRLSARQHGALIVLQRSDSLREFMDTGVQLNAIVTPELLLQIFYPNTPLHDGAVIIVENRVAAAGCVMPLSASGILNRSPERHQMGLRHRAALGISEATDAIAVVVSEETGSISIAHAGRMIRRLDPERLENVLTAFYRPPRAAAEPLQHLRTHLPRLDPQPPRGGVKSMELLNRVARNLPTLLFAFAMAVAVWITSVTQADPTISGPYPRPVKVETIGQDPGTVLIEINPPQVSVSINAPQSIWKRLNTEDGLVSAIVDLSGLGPGTHTVNVSTTVKVRPAEFTVIPQSVTVTLEKLASRSFPVRLVVRGEPAIGYQQGDAELSASESHRVRPGIARDAGAGSARYPRPGPGP